MDFIFVVCVLVEQPYVTLSTTCVWSLLDTYGKKWTLRDAEENKDSLQYNMFGALGWVQ